MPSDPANDRADLLALQFGDDRALSRLIARWERPLFHFAFRYLHNAADARDVVAETFVALYQRRSRFAPDTNLSGWLFTALSNRCHNRNRWRNRHPTVELRENADCGESSSEAAPDRALLQREIRDDLARAVDSLPHDLRVALLLHHYEKLSYRDIAAIVGCSARGVETRLYRARQQLRRLIAPDNGS